jgi:hypothetical protein
VPREVNTGQRVAGSPLYIIGIVVGILLLLAAVAAIWHSRRQCQSSLDSSASSVELQFDPPDTEVPSQDVTIF